MKRLANIWSLALLVLAMPQAAMAQGITDNARDPQQTDLYTLLQVLVTIVKYGLAFAAAIGAIFIVVSGYQYVLSAGNPEKIEKAKMGLTWSIGGFILAISSVAIISFFQGNFGLAGSDSVSQFLPDFGANGTPVTIVNQLSTLLFLWGGGIAVLFLILGGYRYITSQGNQDLIESAKRTILYAVVGLIIVFLAFLIFNLVYNTLRVKPV